MDTYDSNNIFAEILRGEVPVHKVYEDGATLAFMDTTPRTDGHVLVIPKVRARNILDVAPDILADLMIKTQRIAVAIKTALKADGLSIQQYSESAGGQTVFHLHIHILPRYRGVPLRSPAEIMPGNSLLAAQAESIRKALA
ncbi:HIT family protein [Undibacterium terreum]|uniref:Hydrolase n=1 Tax=Undibacterium terreum TaxID=1224302 RepID=A0A916U2S9_9BURK|nr:HIT family protein [Undibacterium terreum]GGC57903.1 hydrolase [Undibacterium terreum]